MATTADDAADKAVTNDAFRSITGATPLAVEVVAHPAGREMKSTPHLMAEILPLLRTADHVDAVRLLADALNRKLSDPAAPSLDAMLGFATPGPSYARSMAKERRNRRLRAWWRVDCPNLTAAAAASMASRVMANYERHRWPHDRDAKRRPLDALPSIAFDLLMAGEKLPGTGTIRNALS